MSPPTAADPGPKDQALWDWLISQAREVDYEQTDPAEYETLETADFVWFTPRVDDVDPCEAFREALENMKRD